MDTKLQIVAGPPTTEVTREVAEEALRAHPAFPKNASVTVDEVDGRWVAAISTPVESATHESAPFPPGGGEGGPPAPEGPPSDEAPAEEGPPSEDGPPKEEGGEDGPPKGEGKEHGAKGLEAQVHSLTIMLHTLMEALGIAPAPADSMMPGAEQPGIGGPPGGPNDMMAPSGPDANPGMKGNQDQQGKTHTVHERALRPGEAQPGSTPIGAPAFASVADDHPWKEVIGKVATFTTAAPINDDETLAEVKQELEELAKGTGYSIKQLHEDRESGQRVARVLLSRY